MASVDLFSMTRSPTENAPHLVYIDHRGNCFLQNDRNAVMEQHRGKLRFPEAVIERWRRLFQRRSEMLRKQGGDYVFLIAPDKQSIFWDDIGEGAPDVRNVLDIFSPAIDGVNWVDPTPSLRDARASRRLYPLTDSHWDAEGAYIAYRALMARLPRYGTDTLQEGLDFEYSEQELPGDLGNKFPENRLSTHKKAVPLRMHANIVYRGGVGDSGCVTVFQRPNTEGVCILFADSFGRRLVDFLAEHFGTLVQVHGKHFDAALVRDLKPQLVISEGTERFMVEGPILQEEEPTEMLFMRKIAAGHITAPSSLKQYQPFSGVEMPPLFMALVRRNDALTQLVLDPDTTTPDQAWFLGQMPSEVATADVAVAAFIAGRKRVPLNTQWREAYDALPSNMRVRITRLAER